MAPSRARRKRQRNHAVRKGLSHICDSGVFASNHTPNEPVMNEWAKRVVDACLPYPCAGAPDHSPQPRHGPFDLEPERPAGDDPAGVCSRGCLSPAGATHLRSTTSPSAVSNTASRIHRMTFRAIAVLPSG